MEHWGVQPDMICTAKAISGGFIPIGAVLMTSSIMNAVFSRMDRAVVHGSTFSKNNMAMAAGLATLRVIEEENLIDNAARMGEILIKEMQNKIESYELIKDFRGKGLMVAIEFGAPKKKSLKAVWMMLELANKGLFSQMITIPLFKNHHILNQVAGHEMNVVKFLPPLIINCKDINRFLIALEEVIADCHEFPSTVWDFGKSLAANALKSKAG
jgi:ornithine--oxo-acid transaminase